MLTLFTAPKPFDGHAAVAQMNALRSWERLRPQARILVMGDAEGAGDAAAAVGAEHVPAVALNDFGTPLADSVFRLAHEYARDEGLLAWMNADIIVLQDFADALVRVGLPRFLVVGRRRNVDRLGPLAFGPGWERELRARSRRAKLERPWGSDYFAFPADGTFSVVPPFAIGRAGWDNWMIGQALRSGVPVVDATAAITAVHERHGHEHIRHFTGVRWGGPESDTNVELLRSSLGSRAVPHLWDSSHVLGRRGLHRTFRPAALWRRLRMPPSLWRS